MTGFWMGTILNGSNDTPPLLQYQMNSGPSVVPFTLRWYKACYRLDVLFLLGASGSCGGVDMAFIYLFL